MQQGQSETLGEFNALPAGGVADNSQGAQGLLFVLLAEAGGLAGSKTALRAYMGTPGRLGFDGGAYVNTTTASGCQALRSH